METRGQNGTPVQRTLAQSGATIATKTLTGGVDSLAASRTCTIGVIVQADATNTVGTYIEVGFSDLTAGNGLQVAPGDSVPIQIDDVAKLRVIGAAGQKVRAIVVGG